MTMKLLTVATFLFSTSVMATNQCKPDDICFSITAGNEEIVVQCKDVKYAGMTSFPIPILVKLDENIDISSFIKRNKGHIAILKMPGFADEYFTIINDIHRSDRGNFLYGNSDKNEFRIDPDREDFHYADRFRRCIDELKR